MSIKEKAGEIKGSEGAVSETFFLLETPKTPPLLSTFSPKVSGLIAAVVVAASVGSFALGNYAGKASVPDPIVPTSGEVQVSRAIQSNPGNESIATSSTRVEGTGSLQAAAAVMAEQGSYVGSRKGTKYHLPWCPGARAISEENKVWFATKEEAEGRGYSKAANCKGL